MAGQISARLLAYKVLKGFNPAQQEVGEILGRMIGRTDQRGQATDIVFGVVRNCQAIDLVISKAASKPIERISNKLIDILRIAVYELVYCPKTAEYAIVNEAVELANLIASKKQGGFINAVLRNAGRLIEARQVEFDKTNISNILVQDSSFGCAFKEAILPEFAGNAIEYLSGGFSLPAWLVERWISDYGLDNAWQVCLASNRRPCVYLQPNTLKISAIDLAAKFVAGGVDEDSFEVLEAEGMIRLGGGIAVTMLPGFDEGLFFVQDITAAKVGRFVDPKAGQTIVDLCAAPGGKTVHMAMLMGNKGRIIATDINAERLKKVSENARRLGIDIIETAPYERIAEVISELRALDMVLLDVPCSNTGVMAKRVEVRHRIGEKSLKTLEQMQFNILEKTAKMANSCNNICYSTCSNLKSENSGLVEGFLIGNAQFALSKDHLTLASGSGSVSAGSDGGYVAILQRK